VNFLDFRVDPGFLGPRPHMRDPRTWATWEPLWLAVDGLPMSDAQLAVFRESTGRDAPRPGGYREFMVRKGRQAGWSQMVADRAVWRAAIAAPRDGSAAGTFVVILAQDSRATIRTVFEYVVQNIEGSTMLRGCVANRTADTITLDNGVSIACYPCRASALRGIRALAVYLDEFAFFITSDNRPTDTEVLRAAWPCRAMTGGELGIGSSRYGAAGEFYSLDRRNYGRDTSLLVYARSAPQFNSLLTADYLETLRAHDPEAARSEIDGDFRGGGFTTFLHINGLHACQADWRELVPRPGVKYRAHFDASSGKHDPPALAVASTEGDRTVVSCVRAWATGAEHNTDIVIGEAAALLTSYGLREVTGDRYAVGYVEQAFRRHGIRRLRGGAGPG
jgi:hypothetical protein